MKTARTFHFLTAALAAFHFAGCSGVEYAHVAPGKSASAALAERKHGAEAPVATAAKAGTMPVAATTPAALPSAPLPPLPSGNVTIPGNNGAGDAVAESYSRGTFAMQAGQNAEAISALEQTVKLDPDFTDAWGKLAILYQRSGDSLKATEAFKKAKRLGDANGGTVTRDAAGGLQLQ